MANNFFNRVNLAGHIQNTDMGIGSMPSMPQVSMSSVNSINSLEEPSSTSFKGVMSGLVGGLNQAMNAPDNLLKDAMTGNNDVDIHDVMTAMAKAEINVNIATQVTSKVIQAYDKIMQISV